MKFTVQTILSMPTDGASAHLLIFDDQISILLDCGIPKTFDFSKYRQKQQLLKNVRLVLISHSQLEYSGAIAFLVDELDFNPKIFYTTQSIMRYSPLNVHEQLLCLRLKNYGKKVFNRIYKIYQSIKIIKPLQKKCVELQPNKKVIPDPNTAMEAQQSNYVSLGDVQKPFYFTCFCAGSNMGSLAWRLSFGLVNILYLVEYNNFSLYHINGIDLPQIMQPTDILITDTYRQIEDNLMKKNQLYLRIKQIIIKFYQKNGMSFERPPVSINIQAQRKLVFSCYPNQMIVQIMAVTKKVIQDIQAQENRQKIRVIHLSSRFLQLIKSQMDYFSSPFKDTLENTQLFFIHSKQISGRINIGTFQSLESLLSNSINSKPIEVHHFGPELRQQYLQKTRRIAEQNVADLKLLNSSNNLELCHSASKIQLNQEEAEGENNKMEMQQDKKSQKQMSQQKQSTVFEGPDEGQIIPEVQPQTHQALHGKYFSQVGFPRFNNRVIEEQYLYDDYGSRHKYERFYNRRTIADYKKDMQIGIIQPQMQKKNSKIQIMNLEFRIPTQNSYLDLSKIQFLPFYSYKTNFNSSVQLIMALKPDNVILINTENPKFGDQTLSNKYKALFNAKKQEKDCKKIKIYDINPKNYCHIQISNELISYKVNYIPIPQERKLQKVKGIIKYSSNGTLEIHLDCLEEREHLDFRLDKFYKKVKSQEIHECLFTRNGLLIDGVKIYRQNKRIILQGQYSQQYFKVRRLLYDFLKLD